MLPSARYHRPQPGLLSAPSTYYYLRNTVRSRTELVDFPKQEERHLFTASSIIAYLHPLPELTEEYSPRSTGRLSKAHFLAFPLDMVCSRVSGYFCMDEGNSMQSCRFYRYRSRKLCVGVPHQSMPRAMNRRCLTRCNAGGLRCSSGAREV